MRKINWYVDHQFTVLAVLCWTVLTVMVAALLTPPVGLAYATLDLVVGSINAFGFTVAAIVFERLGRRSKS